MPGGRPSKYDPAYCDQVVEMAKQGMGPAEYAAAFDVCRQTIDNWKDTQPEFLDALTRAKAQEQAWWERTGREGMFLDRFNAPVWKKSVEARFRDDYTERRETELSGKDGNLPAFTVNLIKPDAG